ncbi:MAG: DUF2520 domain-containing protein [Acidimicrobiales bacterium]
MTPQHSVRIVGPGRAGGALALALNEVGWNVLTPIRRGQPLLDAAEHVDLVLIATPDAAIGEVAAAMRPVASTVVAHLSGAQGVEVLSMHPHRAAFHPLTSMPTAESGAIRLRNGAWFAVDANTDLGMAMVETIATQLGGRSFIVHDEQRVAYHAAAAIASNHVVALLSSAERIARSVDIPIEAYLELVRATIDNFEDHGSAGALTGPVARGDWETVERHRAAIDPSELALYDALVEAAQRVVESQPRSSDSGHKSDQGSQH